MSEVCQGLSVQDSVLLSASCSNMPKTIRAAIEEGANPNITRLTDGYTPLLLASWYGSLDNLKVLVDMGADINLTTINDNASALMIAAQKGFVEIVEYLLSLGADQTLADKDGDTALSLAQKMGHLAIVELLSR